jgi:Bacterial extracellular solute-binding proteins, family 5 Middle
LVLLKVKTIVIPTLVLLFLLALSPAFTVSAASSSFSNPSVISASAAQFNGPRVSNLNYLVYSGSSADTNSYDTVVSGAQQIMDFPPQPAQVSDAYTHNNLNVTGGVSSGEEFIYFNQCDGTCPVGLLDPTNAQNLFNPSVPDSTLVQATSANLNFRQAFAHFVDYASIGSNVLTSSGVVVGVTSQNLLYSGPNSAFSSFTNPNIVNYAYSLTQANASMNGDPYVVWHPGVPSSLPINFGTTTFCTSTQLAAAGGVWEFSTTPGTPGGSPNGTVVAPTMITRPDHPTWLAASTIIQASACSTGLDLALEQVTGFGNVRPIIFNAYSPAWEMYFGGVGFSSPINPITDLLFAYSVNPGWTSPFLDTTHFYNATIEHILQLAYNNASVANAEALIKQADYDLSQQLPQLNIWWDNTLIPSLNNNAGTYWSGYVDVPGFSSWTFATAIWNLLNVHMVNPNTGATIPGGTLTVGLHENPDDLNVYQAISVYDLDVLNSMVESPVTAGPTNPTLGGLIPWMTTSLPTSTGFTGTTPHGYSLTGGQKIVMNFMQNITWQDNVPFTAADYNFSLWEPNLNGAVYNGSSANQFACYNQAVGSSTNTTANMVPCWAALAQGSTLPSSTAFTGTFPGLVDSVVNSTYTMTVYVSGTGLSNYISAVDEPTVPMHLWINVPVALFNADVQPENYQINGTSLMTFTGPFIFSQFNTGKYVQLYRNPGYFRTDIQDWTLPLTATGTKTSFTVNMTQEGTPISTISSSAVVTATLLHNGASMGISATLTKGSGAAYSGTLDTSSLSNGFYEVVVNGTYTDAFGLHHTALQYWGLNIGTPSSSSSVAPPPSNNTLLYVVVGAVVAVVVIVGVVAYVMRRKPATGA